MFLQEVVDGDGGAGDVELFTLSIGFKAHHKLKAFVGAGEFAAAHVGALKSCAGGVKFALKEVCEFAKGSDCAWAEIEAPGFSSSDDVKVEFVEAAVVVEFNPFESNF